MKTGMELLNGLRTDKTAAFNYSGEGTDPLVYRAFDAGMSHSADLLQAWLREADKRVVDYIGYRQAEYFRERILGTTQKPGQEGEAKYGEGQTTPPTPAGKPREEE